MVQQVTLEQQEKALTMAAEGKTLAEICGAIGITQRCFYLWRKVNPTFETDLMEMVSKVGNHALGDRLLALADEEEDLDYVKVQGQHIQWLLARRARETYGDKVQVEETKTINITLIEQRANERRTLAEEWRSKRAVAAGVATQLLPDSVAAVVDAEFERVPDTRAPHYKSGVSPAPTEDEDDIYG